MRGEDKLEALRHASCQDAALYSDFTVQLDAFLIEVDCPHFSERDLLEFLLLVGIAHFEPVEAKAGALRRLTQISESHIVLIGRPDEAPLSARLADLLLEGVFEDQVSILIQHLECSRTALCGRRAQNHDIGHGGLHLRA